jgi:hypothetical protein
VIPAEPACWSWPVPSAVPELAGDPLADCTPQLRALLGTAGAEIVAATSLNSAFYQWHDGRCALCGRRARLVTDHDHQTGLVRGMLCTGCNTAEGMNRLATVGPYAAYRERDPASILGVRIVYIDPFTGRSAEPVTEASADRWTDNAVKGTGM